MRNLIQFIWRQHFTLLFFGLQFIAFFLLVQNNSFQRANFLGFANEVSGRAFEVIAETKDYLSLKEVNENLAEEIALLKSNEQEAHYGLTPWSKIINDSLYRTQYEYTKARVVNSTVSQRNNYLTLNQGSVNGLQPEMGVVCNEGIIGIIKNVSKHYSSVISVLHSRTQVSAKLKSSDYFGVLKWNGEKADKVQLSDIPSHVAIAIGDTVVTRGSGGIFPRNIMIGTIADYKPIQGTDFYEINLNLAVDFRKVSYVFAITNALVTEQKEVELNQTQEDD
ncbi:MAG: rod shape-determining protein MreC [Bacteroidetes bacterium]|nr:rod shape-determining protein MreC [Crocinitomicaceae bacterium]MCH9822534.1 rod shape-determining protein MreC [Bacteroidota bacterium]